MKIRFISVTQLRRTAKKYARIAQRGTSFVITRYKKPVAFLRGAIKCGNCNGEGLVYTR